MVVIDDCSGNPSQQWQLDCTTADSCIGKCPGICACKLDNQNAPYCDCPGYRPLCYTSALT